MNDLFDDAAPAKPAARNGNKRFSGPEAYAYTNGFIANERGGKTKLLRVVWEKETGAQDALIEQVELAKATDDPAVLKAVMMAVMDMIEWTFELKDQPKAKIASVDSVAEALAAATAKSNS